VIEAHGLINQVMRDRGYPTGDIDQRLADLSVDHANVLDHYRAARELAHVNAEAGGSAREQNSGGDVGTEDLRQAMVHYRALFADLLQPPEGQPQLRPART
jgi:hypothetical protein